MAPHTTAEVDCYKEKAQTSVVTKVTAIIGCVVMLLLLLGAITGFIFKVDGRASEAHTRLDSLKQDVIAPMKEDLKEIKADVKALAREVVTRLPPDK